MNMNTRELKSTSRISFGIFQANGIRKEGLKRGFLVVQQVYAEDVMHKMIVLETDNSVWPLYVEDGVRDALKETTDIKCIVSYQTFTDGTSFAVARLFRSKMKPGQKAEHIV